MDISYFRDIYTDFFITHGGLFSKKIIDEYLKTFTKTPPPEWPLIKNYVLEAIKTGKEVKQKQPILANLFDELKLGQDITPLPHEGDLLLRDFLVEIKQPFWLELSSVETHSLRANDQQLLQDLRSREKRWGILTNGDEWQFIFDESPEDNKYFFSIPFLSFSLIDMLKDEDRAYSQIWLFYKLLTDKEFRLKLLLDSNKSKHVRTCNFNTSFKAISDTASTLGQSPLFQQELIQLLFEVSFLFYAEDIGVLPRNSVEYHSFDIRKKIREGGLNLTILFLALDAFATCRWSKGVEKESIRLYGNHEFSSLKYTDLLAFIQNDSKNLVVDKFQAIFIHQLQIQRLWFDKNNNENDMSELYSSDFCDVYQNLIKTEKDKKADESIGIHYTSKQLSNYINHRIGREISVPLKSGDIILDPSCGSGHLLKRIIFIIDKILDYSRANFTTKSDAVAYFCQHHLAGIDNDPNAVFITKLNLWLSCIQAGKPLPKLEKIICADTLKRYEDAFIKDSFCLSNFLGDLGSNVVAVVSNPPWSVIRGKDHQLNWVNNSKIWESRKSLLSCGDKNSSFYFAYITSQIINPDNGIGVIILPGVFFIGSRCLVRDFLIDKIRSYAPIMVNKQFGQVDPSQSFGIVTISNAHKKDKKKEKKCEKDLEKDSKRKIKIDFDLDKKNTTSTYLSEDILFLPKKRKQQFPKTINKGMFPADTLLPIFLKQLDIPYFSNILKLIRPISFWSTGIKKASFTTDYLKKLRESERKIHFSKMLYLGTPENRGNSEQKLIPVQLTEIEYNKCSNKIFRFKSIVKNEDEIENIVTYYKSSEMNKVIKYFSSIKSIQVAVLNLLGLPINYQSWQKKLTEFERVQKEEELKEK